MEHYRGQGRPEYKLLPNVARGLHSAKEVQEKEHNLLAKLQERLKEEGLEKVIRIDNGLSSGENLWNVCTQAQHLGMPTRFLDWSLKWQIGLWFAVENPKNDDVDLQFWVFSVPDEIRCLDDRHCYYKKDVYRLDRTYFINAPIYWSDETLDQIGEIRRVRQHGKFSISPYDTAYIPLEEQSAMTPHLEKYCIPAKIKGQLRLELTSQGIHNAWLYYREKVNETLKKIIDEVSKAA